MLHISVYCQSKSTGTKSVVPTIYCGFIYRSQEVLLDSMRLGPNIARNAALRENVFMMAICIELRIPLFLVGKPGSSKSLAKSIIQDSMHGKDSQTELLRGFKQVIDNISLTCCSVYTLRFSNSNFNNHIIKMIFT